MIDSQQDHNSSPKSTGQQGRDKPGDLAGQALTEALQISFKILKIIMIILVVAFFSSNIFSIKPNEVGLILRFGNIVGTGPERELQPGFHWAWPYPIDRKILIPKGTQRSVKVEFWHLITEQERLQGRSARVGASLKPGVDDYVISGDVNTVHVAVTVKYRIVDAYDYVKTIHGGDQPMQLAEEVLIDTLTRSAVIQSAATFKVDDLLSAQKAYFGRKVYEKLSAKLAALNCGLQLNDVLIDKITPPRQVDQQFMEVRYALEEMHDAKKTAQGDAVELLTRIAGAGYGELINAIKSEQQKTVTGGKAPDEVRKKVRMLLNQAGGSVQEILAQAKVYRVTVVQEAQADAKYLENLLPEYRKNPQVVFSRLLLGTLEKLLVDVRKWYIPSGVREVRLLIDRDPQEIAAQVQRGR